MGVDSLVSAINTMGFIWIVTAALRIPGMVAESLCYNAVFKRYVTPGHAMSLTVFRVFLPGLMMAPAVAYMAPAAFIFPPVEEDVEEAAMEILYAFGG